MTLPPILARIVEAEYPRFSDAEMARRRAAIETLLAEADCDPGTRVPELLIAKRFDKSGVAHEDFDTTSIIRMIEKRFRLEPVVKRPVRSLAVALDAAEHDGHRRDHDDRDHDDRDHDYR